MSNQSRTILIIDDEPNNFDVIEGLLYKEKYQLHYTSSGRKALERLQLFKPDLILLDVMMPDLDGIEVCRRLKSNQEWSHIPVIIVTALSSKDDLAKCLEAGADDFLSRPMTGVELRARVRSMLRIKEQYDALNANLKLREDLSYALVHDIRNPLSSIVFATSILKNTSLSTKQQAKLEQIHLASQRLQRFTDELLLVAKAESRTLKLCVESVDLGLLVQDAIAEIDAIAKPKKITFHYTPPSTPISLKLDAKLFRRVIDNLLSNAIKFSPSSSQIDVRLETQKNTPCKLSIADQGLGVNQELRQRIFEPYEVGNAMQGVTQLGLGLAFCKMVIDAHQGKIFVENNSPQGSVFIVEIEGLESVKG